MRDPTSLPLLTPELLLSSGPLPSPRPGPMRFMLEDWPERERPTLVRECFARLGFKYDIERIPEVPFRVDLLLSMLPGLVMAHGCLHGSPQPAHAPPRRGRHRRRGADREPARG